MSEIFFQKAIKRLSGENYRQKMEQEKMKKEEIDSQNKELALNSRTAVVNGLKAKNPNLDFWKGSGDNHYFIYTDAIIKGETKASDLDLPYDYKLGFDHDKNEHIVYSESNESVYYLKSIKHLKSKPNVNYDQSALFVAQGLKALNPNLVFELSDTGDQIEIYKGVNKNTSKKLNLPFDMRETYSSNYSTGYDINITNKNSNFSKNGIYYSTIIRFCDR